MAEQGPHRKTRQKLLEDELSKLGLSVRHDSRLCHCYINHKTSPEWTATKVAHECAVMHWLYNHTDYENQCRLAAASEYKNSVFQNGRVFADHLRSNIYPAIKESYLRQTDGGCPTPWPWITKEANAELKR